MTPKQTGVIMRKAREAKGWSENRAAIESGMKGHQVKGIENGAKAYTHRSLVRLARVYGIEFVPIKARVAADNSALHTTPK